MQVLQRYRTDAINAQHSLIGIIMASIVFLWGFSLRSLGCEATARRKFNNFERKKQTNSVDPETPGSPS